MSAQTTERSIGSMLAPPAKSLLVQTESFYTHMMLVAIFDSAIQASRIAAAMNALNDERVVLFYAMALAVRDTDMISIVNPDGQDHSDPVLGSVTRNLIKCFSPPQQSLAEPSSWVVTDKMTKLAWLGIDNTFVDQATCQLANGKAAIVCEIEEEKPQVLDDLLHSAGATVLRCVRREIMDFVIARELEALQHEVETLEKETKRTLDGSTVHLMKQLRLIKIRFQAVKERARQYSALIKQEAEAKIVFLQERAARAEGETRARLERVADEVRVDYVKRAKRLNLAWQTAGDYLALGTLLESPNISSRA